MVNQAFRIKLAYRSEKEEEEEKKIPGIGRYLMGPTNTIQIQIWRRQCCLDLICKTIPRKICITHLIFRNQKPYLLTHPKVLSVLLSL